LSLYFCGYPLVNKQKTIWKIAICSWVNQLFRPAIEKITDCECLPEGKSMNIPVSHHYPIIIPIIPSLSHHYPIIIPMSVKKAGRWNLTIHGASGSVFSSLRRLSGAVSGGLPGMIVELCLPGRQLERPLYDNIYIYT